MEEDKLKDNVSAKRNNFMLKAPEKVNSRKPFIQEFSGKNFHISLILLLQNELLGKH